MLWVGREVVRIGRHGGGEANVGRPYDMALVLMFHTTRNVLLVALLAAPRHIAHRDACEVRAAGSTHRLRGTARLLRLLACGQRGVRGGCAAKRELLDRVARRLWRWVLVDHAARAPCKRIRCRVCMLLLPLRCAGRRKEQRRGAVGLH